MFLGIIAKFLEKKNAFNRVDGLRNQTPATVTSTNMDVHVIQGKGQKYLAFLTALRFMKTMVWI